VVRAVIFWSASLLLALWALAGIAALVDVLGTDCAAGASEISDPCALGTGTYVLYGALAWLVGAAPLAALIFILRRDR
jgi:hypothetical protein